MLDVIRSIGQDRIEELLLPQNVAQLRNILLNHVLPGQIVASDFAVGQVESLSQGGNSVVVSLDPLAFNGINAVSVDSIACNGVVHSIGGILTDAVSPPPSVAPLTRVIVDRFYISYRTSVFRDPTDQEYLTNRLATNEYYENVFTKRYTNFRGIDLELDFTLNGDGT